MEKIIKLESGYTEEAVNKLRDMIISGKINIKNYTKATITYDCSQGIPFEKIPEHYPLKFISKDGSELWITNVTAGYRGTGPHGTLDCLKSMGFFLTESQEEEIFTTKVANLTFYK